MTYTDEKHEFKKTLDLIKQENPSLKQEDLKKLIEIISTINRDNKKSATSLNEWFPEPATIIALFEHNLISVFNIEQCLNSFNEFALSRDMTINTPNLDSRLIAHIKIMVQRKEIRGG